MEKYARLLSFVCIIPFFVSLPHTQSKASSRLHSIASPGPNLYDTIFDI